MFTFLPKIIKIGCKWSEIDFFQNTYKLNFSIQKPEPHWNKKTKNNQYPPHSICAAFLIFKEEKKNKIETFFDTIIIIKFAQKFGRVQGLWKSIVDLQGSILALTVSSLGIITLLHQT